MQNCKILPIFIVKNGYLPTTDILQMLIGQDIKGYGAYLFEIYMNTITIEELPYPLDLNYENITCIEHHIYNASGARNLITCDYTEFLINNIDRNLYMICTVDAFYISNYYCYYQKEHIEQNLFIYGYNTDTKIFYVSDYFHSNMCREYGCVLFEELINSLSINDLLPFINQTELITLIPHKKRKINIPWIKYNFVRFLRSEPIYPIQNAIFGYKALEQELELKLSKEHQVLSRLLIFHFDMFLKCIQNTPQFCELLLCTEITYLQHILQSNIQTYSNIKQGLKFYKTLIEKLLIITKN